MVSTPLKFLWKYFCVSFARSAYYLRVALIFTEKLSRCSWDCKNYESLAQWIFLFYNILPIRSMAQQIFGSIWPGHFHLYIYVTAVMNIGIKTLTFYKGICGWNCREFIMPMVCSQFFISGISCHYDTKFLTLFSILFCRLFSKLIILHCY